MQRNGTCLCQSCVNNVAHQFVVMKKILFILSIILLHFWLSGCTKAGIYSNNLLTGKWELRKIAGGWSGSQLLPAGNGNTLSFTGNHYEHYQNGQLADSGTYKTYKDQSDILHTTVDRIEYIPASLSIRHFYEFQNGQLVITMDVYDGVTAYYDRIKK